MYKQLENEEKFPSALEKRKSAQCARRRMEDDEGKEMPCKGEKGDGRLGGCFSSLCECTSAIGGVERAEQEPWERRVPGLQMAWHCCHGYDWHSLYCTTHTVLFSLQQPSTLPHRPERERDLEDGGRGEFIEDMQRLKWGREREKLDRTLKHDGIISKGREGTTVKKSDK